MLVGKFIVVGLPIVLGVMMIGAGAVTFVAGLLLLVPATWWAGAIGSVVILVAAVITLIRCREWRHLPGAVVLTTAAVVAVAIRAWNLATG